MGTIKVSVYTESPRQYKVIDGDTEYIYYSTNGIKLKFRVSEKDYSKLDGLHFAPKNTEIIVDTY